MSYRSVIVPVLLLLAVSASGQLGRSGLVATAVNEEGQPVADVVITLQPAGETTGSLQVIKTDKRGRFANRVLSSGRYVLDVQEKDRFWIKSAGIKVRDAGGMLLTEYQINSHPSEGLASIPVQGGQITEARLVLTSADVRKRLLRQLEGSAVQGELSELVRLYNAGELERALEVGRQLMAATTSEPPDVLHLVGMTYARLGRFADAEPLLRRAVELAPEQIEFAASLGTMLLQNARAKARENKDAKAMYAEAETWLRKTVDGSKNPATALLTNLSVALEGAGRSDEALQIMERIAASDPENVVVRLRMAALLRARGETAKALEILNKLTGRGDPRAADSLYNVALTFYNDQDYESALAALKRAEELNPTHALVQRLLGRVYYVAADPASALRHLRRFLELDPNHAEAEMDREMVRFLERTTQKKK